MNMQNHSRLSVKFKRNLQVILSVVMRLLKRRFQQISRWKNQSFLDYTQPQLIYSGLPAETAGNHYMQKILPASTGKFICRTI